MQRIHVSKHTLAESDNLKNMLEISKIEKQTLIEYENLLFMYVEQEAEFDSAKLYYVDAIIINSPEVALFEKVLREARTHHETEIYLKPIFCIKYEGLPLQIIERCDGLTDVTQYQKIARTTKEIKQHISKLYFQEKFPNNDFKVLYKTMQFLYTRDKELQPLISRQARLSYLYPFLNLQLEDIDHFKVLEILRMAVREGLMREEEMLDKVHLCEDCHSAHHNIRETCLHCNGIDLKVQDLIHHFQCAYIGPETDFNQEYTDELICPKCQKILRHIGVDYDKPSHIFSCRTCSEHFQNPVFTYNCVDCGKISDIRHLQEFLIRKLSMTTKGKQLLLSGLPRKHYEDDNKNNEIPGIYEWPTFKNLLKQEKARTAFNPGKTYLGKVTVVDEQLNNISWREKITLRSELVRVLKSYLKDYDMVSVANAGEYYYLMLETNLEKVSEINEMIIFNLEALVKSNVEKSKVRVEVISSVVIHNEEIVL